MAKENVSQADGRDTVHDSARDSYDILGQKLLQLQALLLMTYGSQREGFADLADEWQDNYMWACYDLAKDCYGLLEKSSPLYYPDTKKTWAESQAGRA